MRRTQFWNSLALTGTLALAVVVTPVRAQDPDDLKRGVARISLINGDVNVRRGDTSDWVAGVVNAPLLTDDRIATGPASRTEVEFDASNTLRLGANAELHLAQLEYGRYQMELSRGLATFRILRQNDVNIEIDTPSVSVRPSRQGSVRISVNEAGETEVTSRLGDVEVFTPRGSQWVRAGQTLMARGSAADPEFQIVPATGIDDWDRWGESRDRLLMQSPSARNVGPGVYGAEDLDNYGSWESVPEYGNVWRPTVAADWSPYHYGRWSWVDWYGWTWVSYDPWGWAPYHYGRWFHNDRFGWCWYPGLATARHYWSPALVGFIGFGGGGGFGFGFGNVGWVPLAPYEVYHPWWGRAWYRSGGYYNRQVNIVNVNVTNTYRNARFNSINSVSHNDFLAGRFNSVTRFNGGQIRDAGAIRGATPFAPGNQHLRYSDRNATNVPRGAESARFFRSQTPSPAQRVPLQQQVGRTGPGGGESQSSWSRFGQTGGNPRGAQQGGSGNVERGGFGNGQQRSQVQQQQFAPRTEQPAQRQQDNRGGWQRFGSPGKGGSAPQQQQQQAAPRQQYQPSPSAPRTFGNPRGGGQSQPQQQQQQKPQARQEYNGPSRGYNGGGQSLRVAPPVVRDRPSYSAPRQSAPSYSAPRQSAPSYSAPRQQSAPQRSAPSGGGGSAPRGNSGGGHQSNGGGGNRHGR
ncbi:MAG TPA: DUF6600 domain-containing protein [Candidatus Acidoferrum sp.]|nr:DUF6600 domain-containing protein [Candidatus Acidoferrum sp.]